MIISINYENILQLMTTLFLYKVKKKIIRWLVRDMPFRDRILLFEFMNPKFRVYKHEISSLQTRNISSLKLEINFEFSNSKFQVVNPKYFEFVNSKFRV